MGKLSDRVRPGSEAAPWVVLEIGKLEAEIERLRKWQREMVKKAADKSLDGYRELGAKCAALERERDEARLRHDDHCAMGCKPPWEMKEILPAEPEVTALMKAVSDMLREDEERMYCHSPDMGGLSGLTIRVQQGERGRSWHETRGRLREALGVAEKRWPM